MTNYYKDGYLEAVLFLFIHNDQVLIEYRPTKNGGTEIFIPNGKIEEIDLLSTSDYRIAAMKREVSEEFANQVEIKHYLTLGEFIAQPVKIKFYGYLITKWEGKIPEFTIEDNKKFADLEWVSIRQYKQYSYFDTSTFFFEKAIDNMNIKIY